MKNGIRFNNLVLVGSKGQPVAGQEAADDAAFEYGYRADNEAAVGVERPADRKPRTLAVVMAVSIACTAAAVATGSYALWLSRHQATQQALTDVNDLLQSCQLRMRQLETDYQGRPSRA